MGDGRWHLSQPWSTLMGGPWLHLTARSLQGRQDTGFAEAWELAADAARLAGPQSVGPHVRSRELPWAEAFDQGVESMYNGYCLGMKGLDRDSWLRIAGRGALTSKIQGKQVTGKVTNTPAYSYALAA